LVNYPQNIQVCNGALQETTNDGGGVSSLAMYPKQPFDFAGRTGSIVFDVSNNSQGNHAAWPELWVTDQPVPDPFTHESTWLSAPRNGFGIRFAGCTDSGGNANGCFPDGNNGLGVDSAVTADNYSLNDSFNGGSLKVIGYHDVLKSGPGQMNHYEVQVAQNDIEVYGTNPFSGTWNPSVDPLVHLASIPNVNLNFSRGLVWLEDVHYNADKFNTQRTNTFTWNDIGFDGPVLPRDLAFDAADNNVPVSNIDGTGTPGINTAWTVQPNSSINLAVPGVNGVANAAGALVTFNFYAETVLGTLNVAVNGHAISIPWPYPDVTEDSDRTVAIPVPLADVVTGNNTLTFYTTGSYALDIMNVDLILQGADGIVNP
jgi:hypothetical protein